MITMVIPFYRNSMMLRLQFSVWASWPEEAKRRVSIILVDDGSPEPASSVEQPDGLPALSIYRILEDRPWHQHAARNLGAHVASDGWLLLTDMDHVLTAKNAEALIKRIPLLDEEAIYTLHRVEADTGEPTRSDSGSLKPHPNSFVVTRAAYWHIGGYDEDYCGIYGTDGLFKARAFSRARRDHLRKVALTRYWRGIVADASTDAPRKSGRVPGAREAVAKAKAQLGRADEITTLNFPWERVV